MFFTRTASSLFIFYHDACFHAVATNKRHLFWLAFIWLPLNHAIDAI